MARALRARVTQLEAQLEIERYCPRHRERLVCACTLDLELDLTRLSAAERQELDTLFERYVEPRMLRSKLSACPTCHIPRECATCGEETFNRHLGEIPREAWERFSVLLDQAAHTPT